MSQDEEHTDNRASRLWERNGTLNGLRKGGTAWRTVAPDRDVQEALADFRDLCFRPPDDPQEPNLARLGCNSPVAGKALLALEALYDPTNMRQAMMSGHFRDGADVVKEALATLLCICRDPDHHLYQPLTATLPPARDPGITLEMVIPRLVRAVERDFEPEIELLKYRHSQVR